MDSDILQKKDSGGAHVSDTKTVASFVVPKKDSPPEATQINPFGLKNLPISVVSIKSDTVASTEVKKVEIPSPIKPAPALATPTAPIPVAQTNPVPLDIKQSSVQADSEPAKNPFATEGLSSRGFSVPKKPETSTVAARNAKTEEDGLFHKSSVDLASKSVGWKTLTPTVDVNAKDLMPEKKDPVLSAISKPMPTQGANAKHTDIPKSTAEEVSDLPTLRTYKKDVAGSIKGQKTSLVRMVLEEQKARAKRELNESPQSKKNLPLILFSLIFFALSAGLVYYTFFRPVASTDAVFAELNIVPLVRTEYHKEISITDKSTKNLSDEISAELSSTDPRLDTLEYIYFTENHTTTVDGNETVSKKIVAVDKLFDILHVPIPQNLLRSLESDYLFGFHNFNKNQPFLILKTDYYDAAFAGMLSWERTLLPDLFPLFGIPEDKELREREWADMVIKNKDTRELKDFDNQTVLMYMFKDKNTMIISTNEDTIFEVAGRLDLVTKK